MNNQNLLDFFTDTTNILSTSYFTYHGKTKSFVAESSCLPDNYFPRKVLIAEDHLGSELVLENPATKGKMMFIHDPEFDKLTDHGVKPWLGYFRNPSGISVHILND